VKIAVIGSGISGLAAAKFLAESHEVTIFEADDRLGGHTNTVKIEIDGATHAVDTGFIVHNRRNYPLFCALLEELGVETQDADMSFSVSCEEPFLEFSGTGPRGLFAQKRNLLSRSFWRLLIDIVRFGRIGRATLARADHEAGSDGELTVESFLVRHHFSPQFIDRYLVPLGASIWSADPTTFLKFPTRALLYFFNNHGLLTFINRPAWRTVTGGSQRYIDALLSSVNIDVQLSAKVSKVRRGDDGVEIMTASGLSRFDTVIMATHSDQALALLSDPTPAERAVLGAIRFQANSAVLHTDVTMMPELRSAWAAWNYYLPAGTIESPTLTYWMNRLQRLESSKEICVTLNRDDEIDPASVLGSYEYHHPVYDVGTFEAQSRWSEINGPHRTWYVGAWWGYGFHEDGVRSARRVADAILEQGS
jgi:predicted NAD/FAD-binding protein